MALPTTSWTDEFLPDGALFRVDGGLVRVDGELIYIKSGDNDNWVKETLPSTSWSSE